MPFIKWSILYISQVLRRLTLVGLIVGLPVTVWGTMNATGFCWDEGRYLDNDEFIRKIVQVSVIEGRIRKRDLSIAAYNQGYVPRDNVKEVLSYSSVDEFLQKNIDCCKYISESIGVRKLRVGAHTIRDLPVHYKILGTAWSAIGLYFDQPYLSKDGKKMMVKYGMIVWGNSCGQRVAIPNEYVVG